MSKKDIANYRNNHYVGQRVKVPKIVSNDKFDMVTTVIIGTYEWFCVVQDAIDPKYRWCVKWVDLIMMGIN